MGNGVNDGVARFVPEGVATGVAMPVVWMIFVAVGKILVGVKVGVTD